MVKTTVYLPDDLKAALGREALRTHVSEAELIRLAIARMPGIDERSKPRFGLYRGEPLTVEQIDEMRVTGVRGASLNPSGRWSVVNHKTCRFAGRKRR